MRLVPRKTLASVGGLPDAAFVVGATATIGMLLAGAAGAKQSKAPPKPQNVVSPETAP